MGKFIYKEDNGKEHEITVSNISAKNIKPSDVVIAHYEVGDAPQDDVIRAIEKLRDLLLSNLPDGVKVLVAATRNGEEDIKLKILKNQAARKVEKENE